jgi:hypothetical protein
MVETCRSTMEELAPESLEERLDGAFESGALMKSGPEKPCASEGTAAQGPLLSNECSGGSSETAAWSEPASEARGDSGATRELLRPLELLGDRVKDPVSCSRCTARELASFGPMKYGWW